MTQVSLARKRRCAVLSRMTLSIVVVVAACDSPTPREAIPAEVGIGPTGELRPGPHDRCPLCAMAPANHLKTAAAVVAGSNTYYTCGNGCALKAWFRPKAHLGASVSPTRLVVQDYFSGDDVDAAEMVFVFGSDVLGPMGPMPVAVRPDELETFQKRHGGTKTFRLAELTAEKIDSLLRKNK